jgi:hypothetical protein
LDDQELAEGSEAQQLARPPDWRNQYARSSRRLETPEPFKGTWITHGRLRFASKYQGKRDGLATRQEELLIPLESLKRGVKMKKQLKNGRLRWNRHAYRKLCWEMRKYQRELKRSYELGDRAAVVEAKVLLKRSMVTQTYAWV